MLVNKGKNNIFFYVASWGITRKCSIPPFVDKPPFWVKQLYTKNFHEWKIIPLQHINKPFGENFTFHPKLNSLKNTLSYFPSFYKDKLKRWSKYYSNQPSLSSTIFSQYLWFNSFIKIDYKVVSHRFWKKKKNFVNDIIKGNGKLKHGSKSLMNLKLIKFVFQMDSTGTCNTKLLENDRKYNKQSKSILLKS